MKTISKKQIELRVKQFVMQMNRADPNYPNKVSRELIIKEIFQTNEYFLWVSEPEEVIREEVERHFERFVSKK